MQGHGGEQLRKLCEEAAIEQDPQKLMELVSEINRLLDAKEQTLKDQHANSENAA